MMLFSLLGTSALYRGKAPAAPADHHPGYDLEEIKEFIMLNSGG